MIAMVEHRGLRPVADADWPDDIADMRNGFAGQLNVYRTMAHHPALLRAWTDLREHVVNNSALGRELNEVVILRSALRLRSEYEWKHHVVRARRCGFDDERIRRLRGPTCNMEAEDAILAGAVDEVFETHALSPRTVETLLDRYGKEGLIDLIAIVGFYNTLGVLLNTCSTPLDDDIAMRLAEDPIKF